ncbi:hypothetical protein HAX54_048060 [Datura stramonium]|uniref:cellulase n=1 Tax=Datura stramonium TaxID=4076 RepID=A0ABS8RQ86_DATST|nr:hypothetical protein [Datura stramonium]
MAFTVTTLAWAAASYHSQLQAAGELENVHSAIKWGTDYFLKACSKRNRLYVQLGAVPRYIYPLHSLLEMNKLALDHLAFTANEVNNFIGAHKENIGRLDVAVNDSAAVNATEP